MSEEDIKYRQGRSKKQMEGNYKCAAISFCGVVIMIVGLIIIKMFK